MSNFFEIGLMVLIQSVAIAGILIIGLIVAFAYYLGIAGITHFFRSLFYYPVRYYYDPTYNVPWDIVSEIINRIRTVNWEVDKVVQVFKKEKRKLLRENKIYVFGHVHEKYVEIRKKRVIIHADTWRDEYFMDKKTKLVLSIIGVAAIVVPALFLMFVTGRSDKTPEVPTEKRQIDAKNVEEAAARNLPGENLLPSPSPSPTPPPAATGSASPSEGTPSGQ